MKERMQARPFWIWIWAAVSGPLAHFSGCGWAAALLAALSALPLTALPGDGWDGLSGPMRLLEYFWIAVVAGVLLQNSGIYWPSDGNAVVPLTLLGLLAISRETAAGRTGPVVGLILAVLYTPVAAAAMGQVELRWLKPAVQIWPGALLAVLLIPALSGVWGQKAAGKPLIAIGGSAVAFALVTQGLLSTEVAGKLDAPFYQVARTVQFGLSTRLELMVTAAVTLGWYAAGSFLLSTGAKLIEPLGMKGKRAILPGIGIAAACVIGELQIPANVLASGCLILWVILPWISSKKKSRKREK